MICQIPIYQNQTCWNIFTARISASKDERIFIFNVLDSGLYRGKDEEVGMKKLRFILTTHDDFSNLVESMMKRSNQSQEYVLEYIRRIRNSAIKAKGKSLQQ